VASVFYGLPVWVPSFGKMYEAPISVFGISLASTNTSLSLRMERGTLLTTVT
jgi:hypothetical protein